MMADMRRDDERRASPATTLRNPDLLRAWAQDLEAEVERLRAVALEAHRLLNQDKRYTHAEAILHAALWPGADPAFPTDHAS